MTNDIERQQAVAACQALCQAFALNADAGDADAFADLFVADACFDRLGQTITGRAAIRNIVASRPPGVWTRHEVSDVQINIHSDGLSAAGVANLSMQRGSDSSSEVVDLRARYIDHFVRMADGWRFASRKVELVP